MKTFFSFQIIEDLKISSNQSQEQNTKNFSVKTEQKMLWFVLTKFAS